MRGRGESAARRKRWIHGFLFGIVFEIAIFVGLHVYHLSPLVALENWAFDGMMRLSAQLDRSSSSDARGLAFIEVDDATWQSAQWGGGEPYRAPRGDLLKLITRAFEYGAQQVVVDVLVEERPGAAAGAAGANAERSEDDAFVAGLVELLKAPTFRHDKQLVLVRSIRRPASPVPTESTLERKAALGELRSSSGLDRLANDSEGRVVIAAPYFTLDPDRVLRGWQLFQVVCRRPPIGDSLGAIDIVPSVPLVVFAKNIGIGTSRQLELARSAITNGRPPLSGAPCALDVAVDVPALEERYWHQVRTQVCGESPAWSCPMPKKLWRAGDLGNRVTFRFPEIGRDFRVQVVPALDLLDDNASAMQLRQQLDGRVVVIAQTFAEARDRHFTPLGEMSGGWVLINAIDSMTRHQFVEEPHPIVLWVMVALVCAAVAGVFANWGSRSAAVALTSTATLVLLPASYYGFRYGVWLDFAVPILGIMFHRLFHGPDHVQHSAA
jgi:CHASE2 domain-containing sensor protein